MCALPLTLNEIAAMTKPTLNRSEVASVMNVDPRTVTVGIQEGTIPAIKLGRRVLIPREKFLKLFEVDND